MLSALSLIAEVLTAIMWPLFAFVLASYAALAAITLVEGFVDGCREKPERADALAALIRSWLTK